MRKIDNWDDIEVKEFNNSERLKLGGHKCIIKNVKSYTHNGVDKISLELDIAEGEQKGFFQKKYDERQGDSKYWDDGATISFVEDPKEDKDKAYFKGLIKAIESYNPNYKWDWDETKLKGKKINVNFSLKEYQGNDGRTYIKPQVSRFVNSKDNFREDYIPSVRTLENSFVKYEDYKKPTNDQDNYVDLGDVVEISDDELAF